MDLVPMLCFHKRFVYTRETFIYKAAYNKYQCNKLVWVARLWQTILVLTHLQCTALHAHPIMA